MSDLPPVDVGDFGPGVLVPSLAHGNGNGNGNGHGPGLNREYSDKTIPELERLQKTEVDVNTLLIDSMLPINGKAAVDPENAEAIDQAIGASLERQEEIRRTLQLKRLMLPDSAQLPEGLSADASPWLDRYIGWSKEWSPRSYEGFHEAVGLWVLSTIAARRIVLPLGQGIYTPLFIGLVARSTLYVKTIAGRLGRAVLRDCGLDWLLAPDESTPQRFIYDLSSRVPPDFDELPLTEQGRILSRLSLAGQRGWYSDEFGSFMDAMNRRDGIMADFRGLLRTFDNCDDEYSTATHVRGHVRVERPYLALLANLTPADIRPFARRGSKLWGDGFWARFAFVAPPRSEQPKFGRFPEREFKVDPELAEPLRKWHQALGMPKVEIEDIYDSEGKPTGRKRVARRDVLAPMTCRLGAGVVDAYYNYLDGLIRVAYYLDSEDLASNYGRFAEKGLRIAILLASVDNAGGIEMRHWARAQEIVERWRMNLHQLFDQVNESDHSEAVDREEKIMGVIDRLEWITPREASQRIRGLSVGEAHEIMEKLKRAGALIVQPTKAGTLRYGRAKDA